METVLTRYSLRCEAWLFIIIFLRGSRREMETEMNSYYFAVCVFFGEV